MRSGAMASGATAEEVQAPSRVNTLESLRVIACLIVVISHIYEFLSGNLNNPFNEWVSYSAVVLFFFISGIVNTWSFQKKPSTSHFYLSRLKRIYPTYFIALTLALFLAIIMGVYQDNFLTNYLFLNPWFGTINTNTPLWSLSYEVILYLALPFLVRSYSLFLILHFVLASFFLVMDYIALYLAFIVGHLIAEHTRTIPFNFDFFPQYGKYTYEVYVYHYPLLTLLWVASLNI